MSLRSYIPLWLLAGSAFAQMTSFPKPDYFRETFSRPVTRVELSPPVKLSDYVVQAADGKKLELPPIIPYPGIDSPVVHEIPDQLELDNGQAVSTTEGGTKAKGIRLVDGDHEISCKIDGTAIGLKACFVKKA